MKGIGKTFHETAMLINYRAAMMSQTNTTVTKSDFGLKIY